MVGMSGKSNEPRGGTSGSVLHSKKQVLTGGHNRTQVRMSLPCLIRGLTTAFMGM